MNPRFNKRICGSPATSLNRGSTVLNYFLSLVYNECLLGKPWRQTPATWTHRAGGRVKHTCRNTEKYCSKYMHASIDLRGLLIWPFIQGVGQGGWTSCFSYLFISSPPPLHTGPFPLLFHFYCKILYYVPLGSQFLSSLPPPLCPALSFRVFQHCWFWSLTQKK